MTRSIFFCFLVVGVFGGCSEEETPQADGWSFWDISTPTGDAGCSTANCVGCCNGSSCVQGTNKQFCGSGGNPCQTCGTNQTCQMGICSEPPCDATNCENGCCKDGKCLSGTADDACGAGGQSCATCTAEQVCASGKCTAKGPPMYKVTLVSAKIPGGTISTCGVFELWSACDPYITLKVGNAQATSSIKVDNNDPAWNEYMLTAADADLTQSFNVEIRDDDPIGSTELGKCDGQITSTHIKDGKYVHDCGDDVTEVTWQIDPV